jgi:hypothetical protein
MEKINIEKMFYCTGCGYMVDDPSESQCCGNLYCQACVLELNYIQCSQCKSSVLKFRKNLFAKNLLHKVELRCRYKCGKKFTYKDMRTHLLNCEGKIFKCTIDFCNYVGKHKDLSKHMIEKHPIHVLIMMENFEEFKPTMDKIAINPIEARSIEKISNDYDHYMMFPIEDNMHYMDFSSIREMYNRTRLRVSEMNHRQMIHSEESDEDVL